MESKYTPNGDEPLTAREAAARAGCSQQYLKRQHLAGNLPALGKNSLGWLLFDPATVDKWAAERQAKASGKRVPVETPDNGQEAK